MLALPVLPGIYLLALAHKLFRVAKLQSEKLVSKLSNASWGRVRFVVATKFARNLAGTVTVFTRERRFVVVGYCGELETGEQFCCSANAANCAAITAADIAAASSAATANEQIASTARCCSRCSRESRIEAKLSRPFLRVYPD